MEKLKIVIISDWFSENMGYSENFLSKTFAELGHDVHLVTSTAQVYYNSPTFDKTYRKFLGDNVIESGDKNINGYTVHRLPLISNGSGTPGIKGLLACLEKIKPQIVQTFSINSWSTYEAAIYCYRNNCKLFTESHIHASVFRKKSLFKKDFLKIILNKNILVSIFNRFRFHLNSKKLKFINNETEICYPIAPDVARIAVEFFSVPKHKIKTQSLGVNTDLFHTVDDKFIKEMRNSMRLKLGLDIDSLVCIYTGRFSYDKKPQLLARAVNYLQNQGENIQALFVGSGTEREIEEIVKMRGCFVNKFVQVNELPMFYWVSDIGVWPSQESTSQLDAAACGLPLILSDRVEVKERVDGNGFLYSEDNEIDLAEKIKLFKNDQLRISMSIKGADKVARKFSWKVIAKERIEDYYKALCKKKL